MTRACFWPGQWIDLRNPKPEDIDLSWVATRLSRIPRYCGGTQEPYSVAQHSVWVADRVSKPARPYALLHDAREAFIGDIIRPCADALDDEIEQAGLTAGVFSAAIDVLGRRLDRVIFAAAGLNRNPAREILVEIEAMDETAGELEAESFVRNESRRSIRAPLPLSAVQARAEFIVALHHFTQFKGE